MRHETVLPEHVHQAACEHLLQHAQRGERQEDLCFALWRPSTGQHRRSAIVCDLVLPLDGERDLHGNASFDAAYLARAAKLARQQETGLAFMHNHPVPGWQDMSGPDVIAERDRISPIANATGLPLVGLTLGTDGSWSARFWQRQGSRLQCRWCDKVRVVGDRLRLTYHPAVPRPARKEELRRTIDTWGERRQQGLARLRIGIVGVGSVGCMVAESLARIGIEQITLIDPDRIETHNLDRLLYASKKDVGTRKVALAAHHLKRSATASRFSVSPLAGGIQEEDCYKAALDCDLLFSAVDRPLPKDTLNRIAYAHCIPVISGGVYVSNKATDGALGQAHWSVLVVGPGRRCLRCDGQYSSSDVVMEQDGSLDDPAYLVNMADGNQAPANQNVFPFSANLASLMVIEMLRLVIADEWWKFTGGKVDYQLITGRMTAESAQCKEHCSIAEKTAYGDADAYPFLVDSAKESKSAILQAITGLPAAFMRWLSSALGRAR